jgi:hypothetical protein
VILKLDVQQIDPVPSDENYTPSGHWFARAHIAVASHSRDADRDPILLSAECFTASEVNYWDDKMIKELEGIKRDAARMNCKNRPTVKPASTIAVD